MKMKLLKPSKPMFLFVFLFIQTLLFANPAIVVCSTTTTWDGSSWDNGTPTNTTNAIFTGSYSSSGSLTACSITVSNSAIVTFNSLHTLTIENDITVDAGSSLVFENNASLLQLNSAGINTGNINYKRDAAPMRINEYTYWGSPVTGQILNILSPNSDIDDHYTYDANPAVNNWTQESPSNTMTNGRGYAIGAPTSFTATPQTFNAEFIGIPNNGDIPVNVEAFDPGLLNYNFISNPYPSAIDVVTLIDNTNLGTLYFWTHNTAIAANVFTTDDYAIRTRTTATRAISGGAVPDQYIAAGQGFFASAGATTTINLTNTMRVAGNNSQFYRNSQNTPLNYYFHLNLTNTSGAFKQIAVGYQDDATNGYDFGTDALASTAGVIQFYSLIPPSTLGFAIQGKAYPWTNTDQIQLGINTTQAGSYDIAIDHTDTFFDDKDIFIEDTSNGNFHNLKTSSFPFTTTTGTFNNRFKLHYQDLSLSTNDYFVNDASVLVYSEKEILKISSNSLNIESIEIFDITGRLLFSDKNINKLNFEKNFFENKQAILITVTLENNQKIRKKLIL